MTLETSAASIIGTAFIDAAGGSIILFGIISLIGLGILLKKLEIGLSSAAMIIVFVVGFLANEADSRFILATEIGGNFGFFKFMYFLLLIGAAIYWAIFLRRR